MYLEDSSQPILTMQQINALNTGYSALFHTMET